METTELLGRFEGVRKSGHGWSARCPAHDDRRASLSIGIGEDGRVLVCCHAGCPVESVVSAVGLTVRDLMPSDNGRAAHTRGNIVAVYDYRNRSGDLLFQVVRREDKTFSQRRPAQGGGWQWSTKGVRRVLYRLPELVAADPAEPVFVVEGEKDADRLAALGLVATTNPGGAGKWRPSYNALLKDRYVVLLPDNDDAGRQHMESVAHAIEGVARSIKVLHLPNLPEKGDVSDWLDAGGTAEDLKRLAREAPEWSAADDSDRQARLKKIGKYLRQGKKTPDLVDAVQRGPGGPFELICRHENSQVPIALGTADQVLLPNRVQAAVAGAIHIVPRTYSKAAWHPIACLIIDTARVVDVGSEEQETWAWIQDFAADCLKRQKVMHRDEVATMMRGELSSLRNFPGFFTPDGQVYLAAPVLCRYVNLEWGQRLSHKQLALRLSRLGFDRDRLHVRVAVHDRSKCLSRDDPPRVTEHVVSRRFWRGRLSKD